MTLFADKDAIVAELRADRLISVTSTYLSGYVPSDDYLYAKLLAAEADAARRLRVFLEPTEVMPEGTAQVEIDALPDGTPWVEEPAYDFLPEMFIGEQWGYLVTRERPIIGIGYIRFAYPVPVQTIIDVPADWIRVDKKYGHIRLVPTGTPFMAPLNAYIMTVAGGGRTIPHMIRIRYTAGLQDATTKWPDLVDLIKKMAVLKIMSDAFLPQSGSISADGLSQSVSVDMGKYEDTVERMVDALRQAIHGVRMTVL